MALESIIGQSWVAIIISHFIGQAFRLGVIVILLFAAAFTIMRYYNSKSGERFVFYLTTSQMWTYCISYFLFLLMMYISIFKDYLNTWGSAVLDLPFHINMISSLVHGFNNKRDKIITLKSSIIAGSDLIYPIVPNFYSAFWNQLGTFQLYFHFSFLQL